MEVTMMFLEILAIIVAALLIPACFVRAMLRLPPPVEILEERMRER